MTAAVLTANHRSRWPLRNGASSAYVSERSACSEYHLGEYMKIMRRATNASTAMGSPGAQTAAPRAGIGVHRAHREVLSHMVWHVRQHHGVCAVVVQPRWRPWTARV